MSFDRGENKGSCDRGGGVTELGGRYFLRPGVAKINLNTTKK